MSEVIKNMAAFQILINLSCNLFFFALQETKCANETVRQRQRKGERKICRVGEGLTEENVPEAAASELRGCVSGLMKWHSSLLRKLTSTELGLRRVTSVAFKYTVLFFWVAGRHAPNQ